MSSTRAGSGVADRQDVPCVGHGDGDRARIVGRHLRRQYHRQGDAGIKIPFAPPEPNHHHAGDYAEPRQDYGDGAAARIPGFYDRDRRPRKPPYQKRGHVSVEILDDAYAVAAPCTNAPKPKAKFCHAAIPSRQTWRCRCAPVWPAGAFMTKPNDGGPAFPRPPVFIGDGNHADWWFMQDGMSRRDWLAGLVLQGVVSDPQTLCGMKLAGEQAGLPTNTVITKMAYELADAMIAEGDKEAD